MRCSDAAECITSLDICELIYETQDKKKKAFDNTKCQTVGHANDLMSGTAQSEEQAALLNSCLTREKTRHVYPHVSKQESF